MMDPGLRTAAVAVPASMARRVSLVMDFSLGGGPVVSRHACSYGGGNFSASRCMGATAGAFYGTEQRSSCRLWRQHLREGTMRIESFTVAAKIGFTPYCRC